MERRRSPGRRVADESLTEGIRDVAEILSGLRGDLTGKIEQTADEVIQQKKRDRWRNGVEAIAVVVVLLTLFIWHGSDTHSRHTATSQREQLTRQNNELIRQGNVLIECTTPDDPANKVVPLRVHECYDRSQGNNRYFVSAITDMQTALRAIEGKLGLPLTPYTPIPTKAK